MLIFDYSLRLQISIEISSRGSRSFPMVVEYAERKRSFAQRINQINEQTRGLVLTP